MRDSGWDTRLKLWNGKELLIDVYHKGRTAAWMEIQACESRIKRGEATHYTIESVSAHGAIYVNELREASDE